MVIPHGVGKCRGATKKAPLKRELATNEVSRLRDCLGSLVKGDSPRCGEMSKGSLEKGAGREFASGLRD